MICETCGLGGDVLRLQRKGKVTLVFPDGGHVPLNPPLPRKWAEVLHNKCKGGTWCDCQHKEGLGK